MSFADLTGRLDEAVMSHLADSASATYTPQDVEPLTVSVIIDRDVERVVGGMQSGTMERRTELTGYSRELGEGKRGETVSLGRETWRLVSKSTDDGHLVTWIVTGG
ncbi:head-tail joining protein [Modicisalibacter luteus]|uniref:Uncharacterized protein n=1 Tax=Modicisalibacter luteus TaxID=453962 RepID=A0ABV7M4T0_9GAMM|nr:hypothetical protein [Halomonas lutea]GHA85414.1 hypothetical protein GCM10007159_03150 [Halomonas lutea]